MQQMMEQVHMQIQEGCQINICAVQARWNIIYLISKGHRIQKFLVHMQKHQKGL